MTFKEALNHYRAGTASEEERQLVEQELEKSRLIAEYLDEQWDDQIIAPIAPVEEMKQVRKTLRRRNILIVLTSLILSAVLLLGTVCIGIPAVESLYWNPATTGYGTPYSTDLELMLAAYAELFCPDINIAGVTECKTGFATYDISIQYWNTYRGDDCLFTNGTIEKSELCLPMGFMSPVSVNLFDRATYPFYAAEESGQQAVYDKLSQLPAYVTVVAAVSFPEDQNVEELLAFQDSLMDGYVGWTAIRTGPLDEQLLPLCGMNISHWGTLRREVNQYYACFDMKSVEITSENLETHFQSLLRFSADQVGRGTGIPQESPTGQGYYTDVLKYVGENGIYSYGCYVIGTPETFLALIESGSVSQVWIEDLWIGA